MDDAMSRAIGRRAKCGSASSRVARTSALRRRWAPGLAGLRERRDRWYEMRHTGHGSDCTLRAQVIVLSMGRGISALLGQAARMYPEDLIELRQGARIVEKSQ
jgi:hypothetical protein